MQIFDLHQPLRRELHGTLYDGLFYCWENTNVVKKTVSQNNIKLKHTTNFMDRNGNCVSTDIR